MKHRATYRVEFNSGKPWLIEYWSTIVDKNEIRQDFFSAPRKGSAAVDLRSSPRRGTVDVIPHNFAVQSPVVELLQVRPVVAPHAAVNQNCPRSR